MGSKRGIGRETGSVWKSLAPNNPSDCIPSTAPRTTSEVQTPQENPQIESAPTPENEPEPAPDSQPGPEIEFSECSQVVQSGIEKTINAQTASFGVGDFELAYSYASPSFQASVTLERFIGIIEGSYGPLISSSRLSFENCIVNMETQVATIDVRFTEAGTEVYALRYALVETGLGWRVDGASALANIGSGA